MLSQDANDHPERYDEDTRVFLAELAAGQRKFALTEEDRRVLDQATLDFAAYRSPKPTTPPIPAPRKLPPVRPPSSMELADGRAPQVETPGGVMTPYWWLT